MFYETKKKYESSGNGIKDFTIFMLQTGLYKKIYNNNINNNLKTPKQLLENIKNYYIKILNEKLKI